MSDIDGNTLRVGTSDRERAIAALDVHRDAGRLDGAEFEDRTVKVGRAKNWADLDVLFTDLPEPRASRTPTAAPVPVVGSHTAGDAAPADKDAVPAERSDLRRLAPTIMALSPFVALVLFFVTKQWIWFLLIPVAGVIVGGITGGEQHGRNRNRRRNC